MDASHYQFPGAVEAVSCLDSAFSVLDKPDHLSHCVSHVPDFVCQECLQLDIQRSFFLTPCSGYAPAQSTRPLPSGQYIGLDNRCPVYHVTFVLRYLAVAQASHVNPRSGANRSCRRVILSGSTEKVSDDILKPLLLIEARRLRTVARKMGTYHVPARWVAQRTRKPPSYDGECPPKPAKRLRWAPVLCLPFVAIERPFQLCPDAGSPVHKRLRMLPPASCLKTLPVPPQASTLVGVCHRLLMLFSIQTSQRLSRNV